MKISFMWVTALLLVILLIAIPQVIKKSSEEKKDSWIHFECGFNPMNSSWLPFSFQFFLISLLFLIFDIEIALVISFPMEPQSTMNKGFLSAFITFLTLGLIYEWQKGKISWSK